MKKIEQEQLTKQELLDSVAALEESVKKYEKKISQIQDKLKDSLKKESKRRQAAEERASSLKKKIDELEFLLMENEEEEEEDDDD
jgi:hypothetical protein